jgi:predicted short-subunit dehydrogenase-like oxidoreductase (DUF2520 family)
MKTINILGAGRLGKSLGRALRQAGLARIQCVLNRTLDSAQRATNFIGEGRPVSNATDLAPADWIVIATPDDTIETACRQLAETATLAPGNLVFHCSGARTSRLLASASARGALIASAHPVKTFANPLVASASWAGTPVALEGDDKACAPLQTLFQGLGAKPFRIHSESKMLYHAGSVLLCNDLAALIEAGLRCHEAAGIPRKQALEMAAPLLRETLANILSLGPSPALTGPIARGDLQLASEQLQAVTRLDPAVGAAYRSLGLLAISLASQQGAAPPDILNQMQKTYASSYLDLSHKPE